MVRKRHSHKKKHHRSSSVTTSGVTTARSSAGGSTPHDAQYRTSELGSEFKTSSMSYLTSNPRSGLEADQDLPQTPADGLPNVRTEKTDKSDKTQISSANIKRNIKATVLTFRAIVDRPNVARVQLLLCNISDRALYFKLKSNVGSNVSALPAGSAQIAPHAQVRLVLTWTRPSQYEHWRDVPPPKLLIVTKFLDSTSEAEASQTSIRLIARVSSTKTCFASNPPVEQLLLDAVGKSESMEVSSVVHETQPRTPEQPESQPVKVAEASSTFAEFLNGLTDRGLLVLIIILLACMYIISRLIDKSKRK